MPAPPPPHGDAPVCATPTDAADTITLDTGALDAGVLDTDARALCAATARWLRAVQALEWLALAACAAALWRLLAAPAPGWTAWAAWAVLVLALPERLFALRLRFDRGLFVDLAEGRIASLQALDAALSRWRPAAPGAARPLDARIAGTLHLWRRHAAAVGAQALLCLLALLPAG